MNNRKLTRWPGGKSVSILLIRALLCTFLLHNAGCEAPSTRPYLNNDRGPAVNAGRQLSQAEAAYNAGDYELALAILERADPRDATAQRLRARSAMGAQDWAAAQAALESLDNFSAADLLLLGEICAQLLDHRCSADAYIQAQLELGFGAPELPADLHDRIWLALEQTLTAPEMFTHRYHHAWWLLQEQIRQAQSATTQIAAWEAWRARYPSHPAALAPPRALAAYADYSIPDIGILLPLSGQFAAAGAAVRDGLIAARLADPTGTAVAVRFYDTAASSLPALWEQAERDGIDAFVGPLLKQTANEFADLTRAAVQPRLVLNYLDNLSDAPSPGSPFQFGIAIEDEAASLVMHLSAAHQRNVLVVHGPHRWAQRAYDTLNANWPETLVSARFSDPKELTQAVGKAMLVSASEQRKRALADVLGEQPEFLPRARRDIDAVVAITSQLESQALVPALRFHFADKLPVYSTSQAMRGPQRAQLRTFKATEMPLLRDDGAVYAATVEAFGMRNSPYAELYALGFDAFALATWLPLLEPTSNLNVNAASGRLWLESGGRFRRHLELTGSEQ